METLAWILGFIIFSFAFTLLVGRFMKVGKGPNITPPFDQLAAKHDALVRAHDELAHELGAEVQQRLADNRLALQELYTQPWSVNVVSERAKLYLEIREDEELLRGLGLFGPGKRVLPESYDWL